MKGLCISSLLALIGSSALATETLEHLKERAGIAEMNLAIRNGDNTGFRRLPAKGYSDGLSGILKKYRVYPDPEYSFTSCGDDDKFVQRRAVPGCRVSIKVARRLANGRLEDTGIRIEYAIGLGEKSFVANRSAWADNAITGNGVLEGNLTR